MKKMLISLTALLCAGSLLAQNKAIKTPINPDLIEQTTVFANQGAYHMIPNLMVTPKNTILAIVDRRPGGSMNGQHLAMKRSEDGGKTWSEPQVILEKGENTLVNSAHVIDRKNNRIFVLVNYFAKDHFVEAAIPGYESEHVNRQLIIHSTDDGKTWSEPQDITRMVKPETANYAIINAGGKGIQLRAKPHRGRLIVPIWVKQNGQHSAVIYSDDFGKTWQLSDLLKPATDAPGSSTESQVFEAKDGTVHIISRTTGGQRLRRQAISKDGGATWTDQAYGEMVDPNCQASIHTLMMKGKQAVILVHPGSTSSRAEGTVSVSFDNGKTWPIQRLFAPGSFGYSGCDLLKDGTFVVFYEAENRQKFNLIRFPLKAIFQD